jgi:Fic family protein
MDCMSDLEKFIYAEEPSLPVLVQAALIHVQLEYSPVFGRER